MKQRLAWGSKAFLALSWGGALAAAQNADPVVVDTREKPRIEVSWTVRDGTERTLKSPQLEYTGTDRMTPIGGNAEAFVAVGGARVEFGAGNPAGAVVRVGLSKIDVNRAIFPDPHPHSEVTIRLSGVHFISPAVPREDSVVQHMRYNQDDVSQCGLPPDAIDMFNLASRADDLNGKVTPDRGRFSAIGTSEEPAADDQKQGDVRFETDESGGLTMTIRFPYRLLRHKLDPWFLETPGTFFEPQQIFIEFEVVSPYVALTEFGLDPEESLLGAGQG